MNRASAISRLKRMFDAPRMYTVTREAFVVQVCETARYLDVDELKIREFYYSVFLRKGNCVDSESCKTELDDEFAARVRAQFDVTFGNAVLE